MVFINIIVCIIIISGFSIIFLLNNNNYNKIVKNDIENISKLSSSTIYAEIDNSLTKPIYVSQTMANDLFLKNWLATENTDFLKRNNETLIQEYLNKYRSKYEYDSVFLVSAKSNVYYHYAGVNKIISPEDQHDIWYYNFINSNDSYELDVDFDEANSNILTVFVNCRVLADDGSLLGVVGVGLKMDQLQSMLKAYETDYNLKATLINNQGVVQVDSDEKNIETINFFDNKTSLDLKDKILENHDSMVMFWHPNDNSQNCVITQYIDNLDWYLIVQKDTLFMREMINSQFGQDILLLIIVIYLVLTLTTIIINRYNKLLLNSAITDDVTDLPNMKMFYQMYARNEKKPSCSYGTLFMFDIDNFKKVNDDNGHLFGNAVLYNISMIAKNEIGNKGIIARFGGDEFVGVIYTSKEEADNILQLIHQNITNNQSELKGITISTGATRITSKGKINTFIKESDTAMYRSKISGRNKVTYFE